jgi:hypothetical protein
MGHMTNNSFGSANAREPLEVHFEQFGVCLNDYSFSDYSGFQRSVNHAQRESDRLWHRF